MGEIVAKTAPKADVAPGRDKRVRLVLLSALMLFVELALIRWTGSNIVYLSYFSNFVLLGSFLGIGVGFLRARARIDLWPWAPIALAVIVAFVLGFPVKIDRSSTDILYFGEFARTGLPAWVTLPVIFVSVAITMAMIAEGVARMFALFEPLEAYRLDILGSICGIVGFSLLSFLRAPPVVWGSVAAVTFAFLLGHRLKWIQVAALIVMLGFLTVESRGEKDSWSPYYKVTVEPGIENSFGVGVNGIPHQAITSVEMRRRLEPVYFLPYERTVALEPGEVLVVGAGNGTDVAIALSMAAETVDAVEIDPRLFELGEELHPDRPYDDERVTAHIDDGRAFLERGSERYDMIIFALPDSLTLVSGQSSLRLESYLFTIEAMREARDHLKPDGVFTMYNFYREQWLVDRLSRTLTEAYGHAPCVDLVGGGGLAVFTIGKVPASVSCPHLPGTQAGVVAPPPVTDDYPFLYLKRRTIPSLYLTAVLLILIASLGFVRVVGGPFKRMAGYADLFFMGAAFLLLETKNVVQFALLFGTTWFVNALVFTGILVAVLAAIEVARHVHFRKPERLYALLLAALVVAWAVPAHVLLNLALPLRFVAAVTIAFAPIFLANLVFAERFRGVGSSTSAFGANLLGAMVGGVLEYGALLLGYRALLIGAALLYGLAFLLGRHHFALRPDVVATAS